MGALAMWLFSGCVLLCVSNIAHSADETVNCAEPQLAASSAFACELEKTPKDSTITLGARIGQDTGEGYLSLLVPLYTRGQSLLFLNPRGSLRDEGETEGNIGLGYRYLLGENKAILGANVYRDYRRSKFGNSWKQWGAGLEFLSNWVDARANYYKPEDMDVLINQASVQAVQVSTDTDVSVMRTSSVVLTSQNLGTTSSTSAPTAVAFFGHGLVGSTTTTNTNQVRNTTTSTLRTTTRQTTTTNTTTTNMFFEQFEGALEGWDAEIGVKLPLAEQMPEVRLFYGYYDFDKRYGGEIRGPKARLEIRSGPYFTMDAEVFDDEELNDTKYFVGVRFHMPFDLGKLFKGQNPFGFEKRTMQQFRTRPLASRITEDVIRDVRIQTSESEFAENQSRRRQKTEKQVTVAQRVDIQTFLSSELVTTTSNETNSFNLTISGNPDFIEHFDSTDGGLGADDGTFESPHTTLVSGMSSQPSREVNLLHGDSTFDNGGSNYEITSNQILVSESAGNTATITTDQGAVVLPEANPGAAVRATITNGGVQINSENVTIQNVSFNSANISTADGNTHENITISNVSIVNGPGPGSDASIQLGGSGNGTVQGNINLENIQISGGRGIFIEESSADVDITATNVDVRDGGTLMRLINLDGSFTFNNVDLANTESPVLEIFGGSISGTMDAASSIQNGAAGGDFVNIGDGHTGTIASAATFEDTSGRGMNFSDADGNYTFSGPITLTGNGSGIDIISGSEGSFTFSGPTTINVANNSHAIEVANNLNPIVNFSGMLNTTTVNGSGINITDTGGTMTFGAGTNSGTIGAPTTAGVAAINISTLTNNVTPHDLTVNVNGLTVNGSTAGAGIAVEGVAALPVKLNVSGSTITGGNGGANQGGGAGIGGAGGLAAGQNGGNAGDYVNITLDATTTVTGGNAGTNAGGGAAIGGGGAGSGVGSMGGIAGANNNVVPNSATTTAGSGSGAGTNAAAVGSGGDGG